MTSSPSLLSSQLFQLNTRQAYSRLTCHQSLTARFTTRNISISPAPRTRLNMAAADATSSACKPRYIDIGINLADPVYRGRYNGTQRHPDDLHAVVSRAQEVGCEKMIITGSDFTSSEDALEIAKGFPGTVYTTAGIHPCSSAIFSATHKKRNAEGHSAPCQPEPAEPISEEHEPDEASTQEAISRLRSLIESAHTSHPGILVAFGEFGLDYDRLQLCSKKVQLHSFAAQLDLVLELKPQLPLFLHSRAAHADFVGLLKEKFGPNLERLERGGVVHSFTGTAEELRELMDLGLHVGANGCSFKTADNCAVVSEMRLDRLMLETDGPWCEIRPSHEGWKHLIPAAPAAQPPVVAAVAESGTTTPGDSSDTTTTTTTTTATETTDNSSSQDPQQQQQRPRKQKQQQQQGGTKKKPQKKEPEVPERFRSVKKEKWTEGVMIKSRNEPCTIERVAKVVASVKGVSEEELCEAAWANTIKVFGLDA